MAWTSSGLPPRKNIALATQPDLPVAYALGDQTLLMRALCNLIDNAIKYSPADTRIDCGIEEDDGYWRISVRDQGRGIAAQDLDSLFEPFSRVAADTRKDVGGAGLAWPSCARWRNATAAPRRSAANRAGARSSACGCRWRRSTTANSHAPPRYSKTCEITAGLPALISSVPRYGGRSALRSTT